MSLRIGVVVDTHPEDNSVDLVMVNDGSRLVGVQVMSMGGSTRTGTIDLPEIPAKKNKWDITEQTDQEVIAVVGYIGRNPVVTGFLLPQINQVTFKDKRLKYSRHQSDVATSIDGEGNIQITHPSGAYIRMGETADMVDYAGKNVDANSKNDRNTGRKVNFRIGLAGNAVVVTMTPTGDITFKLDKDFSIDAGGNASLKIAGTTILESGGHVNFKAPSMKFEVPTVDFTGLVAVDEDVIVDGVSSVNHNHDQVVSGDGVSGPPVK